MAHIDIDENRWPIVIITLSGKESKKDIHDFLLKMEAYQARDEDFCFVMDLRELKRLPQEAREQLINWLKETDMHQLAGTAVVVSSSLMRVYLSSVIWISRSPFRRKKWFKHKTVCSLNEAYEWSRDQLHLSRPRRPGDGRG